MRRAGGIPAIPCAVAYPCDESSLRGAVEAAEAGLIEPTLVGPARRIEQVAAEHGIDLAGRAIVDVADPHAAAAKAVELVRAGKAELLMKGSLHTDELLSAVVAKETGLRTGRRISHVFIMVVPTYPEPLLVTDAAVNIAPDLKTKVDIVQNAIDLALGLGIEQPRVAVLSAVETINLKIATTCEAAILSKMADRGQIKGGVIDGPFALDNAISPAAARIKGIVSPVAGRANILLVPDLEAGNMLAKNLSFLANADAAGIVLGARVPIILTSRADSVRTRMASCAVAALYAHARRQTAEPRSDDRDPARPQRRLVEHQVPAVRGSCPATGWSSKLKGQMEGIGTRPRLVAKDAAGTVLIDQAYEPDAVGNVPAGARPARRLADRAARRRDADRDRPSRGPWRPDVRGTCWSTTT